jgi:hypothetical protein
MAVTATACTGEPIASLTRALDPARHARGRSGVTRRPRRRRWALPPGCRLAVGLGEAPLLRQATFSVWDDAASMEAYLRHGAHRQASASASGRDWFSESMFVRLVPLAIEGRLAWPHVRLTRTASSWSGPASVAWCARCCWPTRGVRDAGGGGRRPGRQDARRWWWTARRSTPGPR